MKLTKDTKTPETLEECLELLKNVRYKAWGFPMVFLHYDYELNHQWHCTFRNPSNFNNPDTSSETPLEACQKMIEFLKSKSE